MIRVPTKQSKEVLEFATISQDARAMARMLRTYVSPTGKGSRSHLALHHSQFSVNPYNFFVVNHWLVDAPENATCVVVNPKILEKIKDTDVWEVESCMSFDFRHGKKVKRYRKIKVRYQVPDEKGEKLETKEEVVEGLMAYIFQHEAEHARGTHIYAGSNSH